MVFFENCLLDTAMLLSVLVTAGLGIVSRSQTLLSYSLENRVWLCKTNLGRPTVS